MNSRHILIAALLSSAFAPAMAHSSAALPSRMAVIDIGDDDTGGQSGTSRELEQKRAIVDTQVAANVLPAAPTYFDGAVPLSVNSIKNAPYSAEIVSEVQHNLADGNQIINKRSTTTYRDSAGRTRQELRDAGGTLRRVTINDPVGGAMYILNPEAKIATRVGLREMAHHGARKARVRVEDATKEDGERVIVKQVERVGLDEARTRVREHVRIRMLKDRAAARMAGFDRIGPAVAGAFGDMKWASKATVKDLGSREIEGIKAQGKVRSYEIPAGEIGNRNPIVVTSENWYSPELQVTLLAKRNDPRTGERTWRLANIKRDEPAASLFIMPTDFTVKDATTRMKKIEKK